MSTMYSRSVQHALVRPATATIRAATRPSMMLLRSLSSSPRPSSSKSSTKPKTMLEDKNAFGFVRHNPRPPKPRKVGVTEIRGPYYSAMGKRYLQDILETMGHHIDGLKFAGGSFSLFPEPILRELLDLAHSHDVYVSTGGWIEHILSCSPDVHSAVDKYLSRCKQLGFDVVELSTGFLSLPPDDWLRLIGKVHAAGLVAKPEIGIQFGAGGDTAASELESMGATADPTRVVNLCQRFVEEGGVERIMIESEGITENVAGGKKGWRTDVVQAILRGVPQEKVMFEAADPQVFNWYVREFGTDVNLFVDHSQIVQLSCLREGIWGMSDTFGKIVSFR
ncbi:hypothetical protein QBC32DRAFT_409387 [Pseudoneurospora amorphoporcata]|uniref:Sulfonate biosynthesis enzyme n=1 Tax=Pseudoneurospora amorphoporcata TaxID=241081 RepID=A0AAN6NP23_9PEZI|nr:hypothetical protein QBC32DRAFT_409387 [Pseudoneurospora amorphoporcata]